MMLDMGEPIRIADLARHLIELSGRDVDVAFTGLRPGEKLYEELRLDGETNEPTAHPQIVVTKAPQPHRLTVQSWLTAAPLALAGSSDDVVACLRRLIPEFGPLSPIEDLLPGIAELSERAIPTAFK
jgi:FlaA1/EpsC-like NDP-sugar epimerase